ncbi:MAG: hypothetical protein EB127_10840 [Alphaproteobacteria bacterium]|nr:hypothetical protein [Alphaproteobacteria bacterium]
MTDTFCPYLISQQSVQYETPMTENEEEIEKVKAQIKVLEKKLSFLEELEKTKSPMEEAYKRVYGRYPVTNIGDTCWDGSTWEDFQAGYKSAQKDYKVGEWEPTPQTPEQVADGLKEAFREAVKQGVVSSSTKPQTLTDLIAQWYLDSVTDNIDLDVPTCVEDLVSRIEEWLPKEHDTNSYKWNQCIRTIKEKLR